MRRIKHTEAEPEPVEPEPIVEPEPEKTEPEQRNQLSPLNPVDPSTGQYRG